MPHKDPSQKRSSAWREADQTLATCQRHGPEEHQGHGVLSLPENGRAHRKKKQDLWTVILMMIPSMWVNQTGHPVDPQLGEESNAKGLTRLRMHQVPYKPNPGGKVGGPPEEIKEPNRFLPARWVSCMALFTIEHLELTMKDHSKTLTFVVAPGMEWPLVLGLTWLKKWNPWVDCREGLLKFPKGQCTPCSSNPARWAGEVRWAPQRSGGRFKRQATTGHTLKIPEPS